MTTLYDTREHGGARSPIPRGTMLDCGHALAPTDGVGTGYAGIPAERRIVCYACADAHTEAAMRAGDTIGVYVTWADPRDRAVRSVLDIRTVPHGGLIATTWTGYTLATIRASDCRDWRRRDGTRMRAIRARATDGSWWHGRYSPDNREACTLRRMVTR